MAPSTPPPPPPTDRDRCVSCGYDARSLAFIDDMATCPECGWGVDRTVLAELPPIRRPFITALALPLVVFALYAWVHDYRAFLDAHSSVKLLIHGIVSLVPAPLLFMARNRLRWQLMPRGRPRLILEGLLFCFLCAAVIVALALNWSYVLAQLGQALGIP